MLQQLLIRELATALSQDFLRSHESGYRHHRGKSTIFADPHVRRVVDMLLLEFEGMAVVDVVADVLLIAQHLTHRAVSPGPIQIGQDGGSVEPGGNGCDGQIVHNQPLKDLIHRGHFSIRSGNQDDPVSLQTFVLTARKLSFDGTTLVQQHAAQTKPCRTPLTKTQLYQAALAGKHLGRELPAVFPCHGAFDAFDDCGDRRAIVFELLGDVGGERTED